MPKKRNTTWSRNKKEKQILTARLIEISLKVDNYIYKHKRIPVCEAEQYMREVSSYKTQCSQDEQTLQVIEKLTRCMKAIMLDHHELRPNIHSDNYVTSIADGGVHAGSISPVYSLPDEDRTQLTQIAEEKPVNVTVSNKDVEIIDVADIDDDDDLIHNETSTAITDYAGSKITVEVDMNRGVSILSLRDVEAPFNITNSDVNCSQSILNNFEGVDQMQQNEINCQGAVAGGMVGNVADEGKAKHVIQADGNTTLANIPNKKKTPIIDANKTVKTSLASNKPIIRDTSKTKQSDLLYRAVVQKKEPISVINTANYNIKNTEKDNTTSSKTFYLGSQAWNDSKRICTINDSSHKLQDANHSTQPAQISLKAMNPSILKQIDKNVNILANTFNATEKEKQPIKTTETLRTFTNNTAIDSKIVKKQRGPRKKPLDKKEIKPKNKRVYRPPKSNKENTFTNSAKNKIIPIYNENVVNDLSWIENIRYVREVKVDENDPKLNLEESFWDNYYLPANWDDNEFL